MDGESTIQSRIKEMNNKTLTIACSSPECSDVFPKCNKQVTGTGVFRRCRNTRCGVVKVHIDLVKEIPLHAYRYTYGYQKELY